jgi:hypothetical protein
MCSGWFWQVLVSSCKFWHSLCWTVSTEQSLNSRCPVTCCFAVRCPRLATYFLKDTYRPYAHTQRQYSVSAGLFTTCFALLLATRYSCVFWFRDLASPGKSRQVLASSSHESIIPCCTDFCYVQQTMLPTPETTSGHSQLRPGRGPDPTTGREANGRSCSTRQRVDLVLRKTVHQWKKPSDLLSLYLLTPSGNCGRSLRRMYPVAKPNDRIAGTPRWWASTQCAICNRGKNVALSEYPYIRQWLQWLRRRGGGRGRRG